LQKLQSGSLLYSLAGLGLRVGSKLQVFALVGQYSDSVHLEDKGKVKLDDAVFVVVIIIGDYQLLGHHELRPSVGPTLKPSPHNSVCIGTRPSCKRVRVCG